MTLLLAELQRDEVRISPIDKVGRNAVATCEVVYDDLPVRSPTAVGEEGKGFRYILDGLNAERILIAAEALGIGRVALRRAVDYANERVVFGRPIGKNQGIAFPLAEARMRLDAAELMIRKASVAARQRPALWRRRQHGQVAGRGRGSSRPTAPCRPTAASVTRANTTWSATGARLGS